MDDTGKEIAVAKDLLLTTADGGKAGVGADNISCFFRTKEDESITRIFLKHATDNHRINVVESPEQIAEMIGVPVVEIECHEVEAYCSTAFIVATNIAAYAKAGKYTTVSLRENSGTGDYFCAAEDAETIRDKIYEAKIGGNRFG